LQRRCVLVSKDFGPLQAFLLLGVENSNKSRKTERPHVRCSWNSEGEGKGEEEEEGKGEEEREGEGKGEGEREGKGEEEGEGEGEGEREGEGGKER
jgi:hypothetical protein